MRVAFVLANVIAVVSAGPIAAIISDSYIKSSGSSPISDGFRLENSGNGNQQYFFACAGSSFACNIYGLNQDKYKVKLSFAKFANKTYPFTNYDWNVGIDGTSNDEWESEWCCPEGELVKDHDGVVLLTDPGFEGVKGFGLPFCRGVQLDCNTGNQIELSGSSEKCECETSEYCLTCGPNNGFKSCTSCKNVISKTEMAFCGTRKYGSMGDQDCRASFMGDYCDARQEGDGIDFNTSFFPKSQLRDDSTAFLGATNNPRGSQFIFKCPNAALNASATEKIVYECGSTGKFERKSDTCEVYCDGRANAVQQNLDNYLNGKSKVLTPGYADGPAIADANGGNDPNIDKNMYKANIDERIKTYGSLTLDQQHSTANHELGQTQGSQLVYDCNIPEDIAHGKGGMAVFQCSKQGQFEVLTFTCPSPTNDVVVVDGRRRLRGGKK